MMEVQPSDLMDKLQAPQSPKLLSGALGSCECDIRRFSEHLGVHCFPSTALEGIGRMATIWQSIDPFCLVACRSAWNIAGKLKEPRVRV